MAEPETNLRANGATGSEESSPPPSELKYKGVRKRKWGKWVSEIRLPNSRERIWLGSYDKPEKAARAFDAAQYCLRGPHANFNFPNSPPEIADGHRFSAQEIQAAAAKFASESGGDPAGLGGDSVNPEPCEERSEPLDGDGGGSVVDQPFLDVFDAFDSGLDLDIYSGFENIMPRNDHYNSNIAFPVEDMELDDGFFSGGGDFSYQSHFLWNFDNY